MKKRIFCLALALLMLVGMLPVSSFAEGFTPDPPECDKGCNQTSVGAHQEQCAVKEYYREIYRAYTAQELYDMKDILGEDAAWAFIVGASWSLDNAKAQELNTLIQNGGPTTPENPCKCCENCTGAEDCECVCGNCQFCEPEEPENPCKCCENCTGAEDCECVCGNCQFCEPSETDPTDPTDPSDPTDPVEPEYPTLTDPDTKVEVTVETLPEGVDLAVNSDVDVMPQLNKYGIPASNAVFALDISLVNTDNTEYQPGAALVKVPVSQRAGTKIGILHNDTFMGVTEVLSDGTVEFYTDSFSEFAGFTVDFHYNGVDFSIDGRTEILLSKLFEEMGITENAFDAKSVVFSDNTLIGVEKQDNGDWLLTSLEAFQTEETLIITFPDHTIVIDVTDDTYPDHNRFTNHDTSNDAIEISGASWFADTSVSYRIFSKVSGVDAAWSVWNGGKHRVYVYLYDQNGNPVDYAYFDHHPASSGWLTMRGSYWYEVTDFEFVWPDNDMSKNITSNTTTTVTSGYCGAIPKNNINWIEVKMYSLDVLNNTSYCKITQKSKFALDESGHTGNRTVIVYANDQEVDRKTVYMPTFEDIASGDLSVTPYNGWVHQKTEVSGSTYKVYLTPKIYKVTLDKQGGSGGTDAYWYKWSTVINNIYYYSNADCTSGIANSIITKPTRSGYTFGGYYNEIGGTGKQYVNSDGLCINNLYNTVADNSTLYAKWTYKVNFNGNGNTGGSTAQQELIYNREQALTANGFERKHTVTYIPNGGKLTTTSATAASQFAGWATSVTGAKVYNDKQSVKNLTPNSSGIVNLYAKWNLGSVTLPTPTAPDGYSFGGWYSDDSFSDTSRVGGAGDTYPLSEDVTLYAKWTASTKKVTYVYSTPVPGAPAVPNEADVNVGSEVEVADAPSLTGYTFSGWSADSITITNGKFTMPATDVTFTGSWIPNTNTAYKIETYKQNVSRTSYDMTYVDRTGTTGDTAYASTAAPTGFTYNAAKSTASGTIAGDGSLVLKVYFDRKTSTVTFKYNGGYNKTTGSPADKALTLIYGSIDYQNVSFLNPYKPSHKFMGWYTADDTKVYDENGKYVPNPSYWSEDGKWLSTSNVTLYAQYELATYTVHFSGGEGATGSVDDIFATVGQNFILPKNGFQKSIKVAYDVNGGTGLTPADTEVSLDGQFKGWKNPESAGWIHDEETEVYFSCGADEEITVYAAWSFSTTTPTVEKEGYEFLGWSDGTNTYPANTAISLEKDTKLTAQWEAESYTITYNLGEGTNHPDNPASYTVEDANIVLKDPTPPEGYDFDGWEEGDTILAGSTGDKEFTAKWKRQTGNLVLDYVGDGAPAIVTVTGQGKSITVVISEDKTIVNLPTGEYTVTAESGRATYTASVDNSNPTVVKDKTVTVGVTISGGNSNWFTAFSREKNKCN